MMEGDEEEDEKRQEEEANGEGGALADQAESLKEDAQDDSTRTGDGAAKQNQS